MHEGKVLNPRDVFIGTCIVLLTLGGAFVLFKLSNLLIVLFGAMIFASTVRPLLKTMTRWRIPQWLSIALIYGGSAIALIALFTLAIPPIISLMLDLFQDSELINQMSYELLRVGFAVQRQFEVYIPATALLPEQFRNLTEMADARLREQALPMASSAFAILGQILLAVVISIYWLTTRRTALRTLLRATPKDYQVTISRIWIDTEDMLGAYLRSQIILGLLIGAASFVGLTILRVPNALPLAVLAGLMEFIPFLGPIIAAIPAILMALTISPLIALLTAAWYLVVQMMEGNYLIPRIMGSSMSLNPLLVLIAIAAGFQLHGILGALLAIPLVGVAQVIVRHLVARSDAAAATPAVPASADALPPESSEASAAAES